MTKLVTIFGGSGFVGRYIARRMAREGWRVRVAVRRPNEAGFVRPYGVVGQVEPILANVRDDASVAAAVAGADAVVNCVGTFGTDSRNTFDAIQLQGAARVARAAADAGVRRLVQISAIGADAESDSGYARTKAEGEAAVLEAMPKAIVLRPSIVFGTEDQFFNRFAGMSRLSPVLPLVGPDTRFQPVYVDDVALAAVKAAIGDAEPGIYELGGPDVETFRVLMKRMLGITRRKRMIVGVPFWIANLMGFGFDLANTLSVGLIKGPITRDQVKSLRRDNVVSGRVGTFADLDIEPTPMDVILPDYLWRFRESGQYAEIKDSAQHLKG